MKEFKVFQHPTKGYTCVKKGVSLPGLFLSILWALYKGLWIHVLVVLVFIQIANELIDVSWDPSMIVLVSTIVFDLAVLAIAFGVLGNTWLSVKLTLKGFTYVGITNATSLRDAMSNVESGKYEKINHRIERTPDNEYRVKGRIFLDEAEAREFIQKDNTA